MIKSAHVALATPAAAFQPHCGMRDLPSGINSSSLGDFLCALFADGSVTVLPYTSTSASIESDEPGRAALCECEESGRAHLIGEIPEFNLEAAEWAAHQYYQACQFLLCREVSAEEVVRVLSLPCPCPRGPSTDYSVDLVFRFLPDLFDLATRLAPEDALAATLKSWAETWPLSSVGVRLSTAASLRSFIEAPALFRLYTDRIALREATDRLEDESVRSQLRADLGLYPELSAVLEKALQRAAVA